MRSNYLNTACSSYELFLLELYSLIEASNILPSHHAALAEGNSRPQSHPLPEKKSIEQQIGKVIIYMENHLSEDLTLEELAQNVELSKYQLIRRFRDETGETPWKYLIGKRVDKAKKLLAKGWAPGQVAVETGFYDQPHFSKAFRQATGQSPKQYQEKSFKNRN